MRARSLTAVLLTAISAVAIAACGSSKPLTSSQLITQGDALCKANQQRFAQIQSQAISPTTVVGQTGKLADSAAQELDGLRGLTPPADLKPAYDKYIAAKQQYLDLLNQAKDAADQQDSRHYSELQKKAEASAPERLKLASAVGFKVCSKPQPAPR